jgi:hypothetical protein
MGTFETADLQTESIASAFSAVQEVVFLFLALTAARRRSGWIGLWGVCLLSYCGYMFLEGNRGNAFIATLLSGLGLVLGGVSKKRVLLGLALGFGALVPLSSAVAYYRTQTTFTSRYDEGVAARVDAFGDAATELRGRSEEGGISQLEIFFQAVTAFTVDRIMDYTPDRVPYAGFSDLERAFYVWIPKMFLPDRPPLQEGNEVAITYGVGHSGGSAVYTPTVGEGYRRFGWIGIPAVHAVAGIVYGSLTALCWARRRKREWAALLVFSVLQAPNAWSSTLLSIVYYAAWTFPKYAIFFYALRRVQDAVGSFMEGSHRAPSLRRSSAGIASGK